MRAHRALLVAAAWTAASAATPAFAQTAEDVATAKAAIVQARELRAHGDLQGALPKFQAAYALVPTPLTGIDYATTLAQLGKLVEAREVCVTVTKMPGEATEIDAHKKARQQASELADQLQTRIPSLTVVLTGAPSGATPKVSVDGRDVPAAALSVPRRLNPGHHTVSASVDAGGSASSSLDLREGESKQVSLDLTASGAAPPGHGAVAPPPPPPPPPPEHAQGGGLGGRKVLALVVGGAGVVAAGVGAYLNLSGKSSWEDATSHCANSLCSQTDADAASTASTQGTIGMIVLGTGLLAVAGGVVLWVTAPHASPSASASGVSAGVALAPNGVLLRGVW